MRARALLSSLATASVALSPACAPAPRAPVNEAVASTNLGTYDEDVRDPKRAPRALVFRAPGFPSVDAPPIDDATLDDAFRGLAVDRVSTPAELSAKLKLRDVDVLVLPYGSAFPVDAWPRIQGFLGHGGGLAVLGGAPFHEPVRLDGKTWVRGPRTTTFAHALLIGPAEPVPRGAKWTERVASADSGWSTPFASASSKTWALTLRLTTRTDFPDEHGSAGEREAVARPLLHAVDEQGVPRGTPLLEIDRVLGEARGGRWLLATTDATLGAKAVHAIVQRALEGASEIRIRPEKATFAPGTPVQVHLQWVDHAPHASDPKVDKLHLVVTDASGRAVFTRDVSLDASSSANVAVAAQLAPGLHHVAASVPGSARVYRGGFWVRDDALLKNGPRLSVSRDWLRKDGAVHPIVGTTYMASDVHRNFLLEPNPHAWDADFAEMKRRGIDFVRTGIWTAWSSMLAENGAPDERILAALEAFVMTAAKHGIHVCFNLFAFLPLPFGGDNPYLDPKSLAGQQTMLGAFGARFRGVPWLHWDLINEPSYARRKDLWSTRAIGDEHEKASWRTWALATHKGGVPELRQVWRDPAADPLDVPRADEWEQRFVQNARRPRKTHDFRLWIEETVAAWTKKMTETLHAAGGPGTLVTLGQDEGGIYERPTQQWFGEALDYTAIHTWWKNDDLLWDGVLTKLPEKPSLHQETGLMRLEDTDGAPWRTPDAAARLLERKLGYAFMGRGTGVVEWAWNVNPFMPIDEESTIGIFRPDGTAKPELDPMVDVARFFEKAAPLLDDFEPDPVLLVIPHARVFLGKPNALDATKVVVRALAERFGVVPTAISDGRLTAERLRGRKLVLLPCPDVLDEAPAKLLLDASRAGTKVLVTGAIEGDSYAMETPSLKALGLVGPSRPVAMHESSSWGDLLFEGQQELTRRALGPEPAPPFAGNVWHEPLPIELSREREPLVKLLRAALSAASVETSPMETWGQASRVLLAPKAALVVVVNERPDASIREVNVLGKTLHVPVRALGIRLVLVDRASGRVVASTPGDPIP